MPADPDEAEAAPPRSPTCRAPTTAGAHSLWPALYPELLELVRDAPLDDRLRQQPPHGRAARAAPQRAAPRSRSPAPTTDRSRARRAARSRRRSRRARCRASSRPPRSSSASTWAPSTSSCQVSSPGSVASGLQRVGRAGHSVGDAVARAHLPALPRRARRGRRRRRAACSRARSSTRACRASRSTCCASRSWRWPRSRSCSRLAARARAGAPTPTASSRASSSRTCSTCSPGRYPSDEFAELRPRIVWERTTGALRAREGAQRIAIANAGHDPRPRPLRRLPGRRRRAASASSTRRWCTRRARARSSCSARRPGASSRSSATA